MRNIEIIQGLDAVDLVQWIAAFISVCKSTNIVFDCTSPLHMAALCEWLDEETEDSAPVNVTVLSETLDGGT